MLIGFHFRQHQGDLVHNVFAFEAGGKVHGAVVRDFTRMDDALLELLFILEQLPELLQPDYLPGIIGQEAIGLFEAGAYDFVVIGQVGNEYVIAGDGISPDGGFFGGDEDLHTIQCFDDLIVVGKPVLGVAGAKAVLPGRPDEECHPREDDGEHKQYWPVCLHGYLRVRGYVSYRKGIK